VPDLRLPEFTIVLRGYDRAEVDAYVGRLHAARTAGEPDPAPVGFAVVLRGYDRKQVDQWLQAVAGPGA
jgi:DivIVA domain-containing protein